MSTVVAIETPTGVAIAGDTRVIDGGAVSSDQFQRVFDLSGVGVGVAGESAAVREFWRSFEIALRDRGLESGDAPGVDAVARMTARETENAGVDAVVGALDADGAASLRRVSGDGRVLEADAVALGTGSRVALGLLEALDEEEAASDPERAVRDVLETVIAKDVDTGGDVDVWTLGSAARIERDGRDLENEEEAEE
ncbi:proteasome beta subunit [Halorubrum xinjiangense]|uniref:Proteasome beta subunit n=1 Tax=Halorubrum xinjiangense TaxID=261291 RepID=A0A1G7P678_9EURY|nr:20S proteasome subunit A/B [Halorubrum xinjiangense]SDF81768.1 proteasome beta subunit [Halorubrum xinjiangense]